MVNKVDQKLSQFEKKIVTLTKFHSSIRRAAATRES